MKKNKTNSDTESSSSDKFVPRSVKRESVFFAHISEDNKNYMASCAANAELSISEYTDKLITHLREQNII